MKRTTAGVIAVTSIVVMAFVLGRCSAPTAAAIEIVVHESVSYDTNAAVAQALDELHTFIQSTSTTTTRPALRVIGPVEPSDGSRWDQLAMCESGGQWDYPPVAGGFSGGIMFHIGTWRANGGLDYADDAYLATRDQQIIVAERVLATSGWGAWPGCSRKYGWL